MKIPEGGSRARLSAGRQPHRRRRETRFWPTVQSDPVKQQVAAHWGRRAAHFDEDFGHSIRTAAERAAWDRILDLVLGGRGALDALDAGCGTGFLSFELAARGNRVTGIDFAAAMLAEARRKAAERGASDPIRGGGRRAAAISVRQL